MTLSNRPMPELPGADHWWVRVGGVQLHVAELGQGPPLVLLHGLVQNWYAWRKVAPLLSAGHRLICLDMRGFGWSEQTRRGYDLTGLGHDVVGLLDNMGLAQVDMLAHDFGAAAAFEVCLRAPERVRALVALNMVHPWPQRRNAVPNLWRMWFTAFWEYPVAGRLVLRRWPAFTRYLLRREVAEPSAWSDADLEEFVEATRRSARANQSVLWQYVRHDVPALIFGARRCERLSVPTLVLAGAEDPVIPPKLLAGADGHADRLEVRVVPGAGHYLHEEHPRVVAGAVEEMTGVPSTRATAV